MTLANRALWMIDRNLRQELSLAGVAEACGVSRYHLAHAFGETTGLSVMEYARSRRLSEAAADLAGGASNILELAMDYGYASHEAFTRAFRARFGVTPETVRKNGATDGLPIQKPVSVDTGTHAAPIVHRIEQTGELAFIGLAEHIVYGATNTIAAQWGRFMPHYGDIDNIADPIPWGINANLDDDGNFDYIAAVRVSRIGRVPKGLQAVRLAPRRYAVFRHDAHISLIPHTYAAIWNDWQPDAGSSIADAASLERHMPTFDTRTGLGGVEIWIPVTSG